MTQHARRGCQLRGDVVQLRFYFRRLGMTQFLLTQAAEVMIEKEVELPGKLCLIKRQPAGDRVHFVSLLGRLLNLRDELDCLFLVLVALLFRLVLVNLKKLLVAEVFLHDDAGGAVDLVDLRHRNIAFEKQPRDVEIWVKLRIERLRIHGGDRGAFLPTDAVILASRSVGRERYDFPAGYSLLSDESRKPI